MNIRWLWGNYVEPQWRLSRSEVRTVHRLVKQRYMRPATLFGATAVWLVIAYAAVVLLRMWNVASLPLIWYLSVLSATIVAIMVMALWSFRLIYTRPVRMAMRELGYDLCITCGYWLRGLGDEVRQCPECGTKREPMPAADSEPLP